MEELFNKYKYYIGGSTISIIIFYLIYNSLKNIDSEKELPSVTFKEDKIVKAEISHEEFLLFMKTLKKELQNLTQSMIQFNANHIKTHSKYKDFRDKLFTKDIVKKTILIDSISCAENQETSNYVVNFGGKNSHEVYKNVIGFRLVNAAIPYTLYNVNDNNKIIKIKENGKDIYDILLDPGSYTFTSLRQHFVDKLNSNNNLDNTYTITGNKNTLKYTIGNNNISFSIKWGQVKGYSYRLFGFDKEDTPVLNNHESIRSANHSIYYVDLVINEIPSIACKKSSKGNEIIARIPFNNSSGTLIYYRAPEGELQTSNFFYPMKLNQLSIQLFDDHGNKYDSNNEDNCFEFEITVVKNTDLFK